MAKKRSKDLEEHIAELEAVVAEVVQACPACGKAVDPDATTCPHCDTPLHEAADLHAQAEESLADLERHLGEAAPEKGSETAEPPREPGSDGPALVSAADVADVVSPPAEVGPREAVEVEAEEEDHKDLEGFIHEIEAEVGGPAPGPPAATTSPRVHPVPRSAPSRARRSPARRFAPIAAGLVLYLASIAAIPFLGRFGTASGMVLASVLVVAGINARGVRARPVSASSRRPSSDYVCPLCGTGIPAHATQCPTCGALFEE